MKSKIGITFSGYIIFNEFACPLGMVQKRETHISFDFSASRYIHIQVSRDIWSQKLNVICFEYIISG